jgi:hypothetical protein
MQTKVGAHGMRPENLSASQLVTEQPKNLLKSAMASLGDIKQA